MDLNKIFDDKELNKIDKNLSLLPDDLKCDIFQKYFYPNRLVLDLLEELNSNRCHRLNYEKLLPLLTNVLQDKLAIDYLYNNYTFRYSENCISVNCFKQLYDQIIINNNRNFVLIENPIGDFCLSWLMRMYH
jgi:hypothetical protein